MGLRSGHSAEGESPPALGSPVARTATAAQRDGAHPPAVPRGEWPLRRGGPAGGSTAAVPVLTTSAPSTPAFVGTLETHQKL